MADKPMTHEEMIEAVRSAVMGVPNWRVPTGATHVAVADTIARAAVAALAKLEASRWRPISEFPPNDAGVFDFWLEWADDCAGLNPPLGQSRFNHEQRFRGYHRGWSSVYRATHFMPLPSPPATTSEGE